MSADELPPSSWVVAAEQFPLKIAPLCVSLATASNWLNNFIIAIIVPVSRCPSRSPCLPSVLTLSLWQYITDPGYGNLGTKITFIWAGTEALAAAYTFFFIPETKGAFARPREGSLIG